MPEIECAAVILAAGASTRLGTPKQLVHLGGETLLARTIRIAQEAGCEPILVVLGFRAEEVNQSISGRPVSILINRDWAEGMGASLRCGMTGLEQLSPRPSHVMLLVCDQVALNVDVLKGLKLTLTGGAKTIAASRYAGRAGAPALFAERYFSKLATVRGDRGARDLIESHAEDVVFVEFPGGAMDLDTPEQLRELTSNLR
jgi:molybdenum cofactor cytidylyltransferase